MPVRMIIACVLCVAGVVRGAEPPGEREMAEKVDRLLEAAWQEQGLTPAPPVSETEFLRRAWLDLAGTIPPVNDPHDRDGDGKPDDFFGVRGYLQDTRPDKRQRLVEYLLTKPQHAEHFANAWLEALLPDDTGARRYGGTNTLSLWFREQFAKNVPYDQTVREVLQATGSPNVYPYGAALFYLAQELKPEELASSTARVFLGTQLECAQCHDHPFDDWKQRDFWGVAAFFARLQRPNGGQFQALVNDVDEGEVTLPDTDIVIAPRFLDGTESSDDDRPRRVRLSEWITDRENPYFAKAAVNRVWSLLFGRGIAHPVDDLGGYDSATHEELLTLLANYFAETEYDLNRLLRTLAMTRAYQLSSRVIDATSEPRLFERMAMKRLTPQQLYNSLLEASAKRLPAVRGGYRPRDLNEQMFLNAFQSSTSDATQFDAGIPQALSLMNGPLVRELTDHKRSDRLLSIQAPFFDEAERVEILFLATLGRPPRESERSRFIGYVTSGGASGDKDQARADVFWALLNSAEFMFNH